MISSSKQYGCCEARVFTSLNNCHEQMWGACLLPRGALGTHCLTTPLGPSPAAGVEGKGVYEDYGGHNHFRNLHVSS